MFMAYKWSANKLYFKSTPDGEWKVCSDTQIIEYFKDKITSVARHAPASVAARLHSILEE